MLPRILSTFAMIVGLTSPLFADYLVRVETIEAITTSGGKAVPEETITRSIEVVCRPGVPARSTSQIEKKTLSLDALLRLTKDGAAQISLEHCFALDNGDTCPDGNGGRKKLLETSLCRTTVTVPIGSFVDLGGLNTTSREGEVDRRTSSILRITVSEYHPPVSLTASSP